jgi:hypothetical protein
MKLSGTRCAIAALIVAAAGVVIAQAGKAGSEFGRHEYEAKCAACHGATGRGDGVDKPTVDLNPADLTKLAKENEGVFPYARFYDVVDGRFEAEPSDMPCFGEVYIANAATDYMDVPYNAERYLETRLVALASYVATLQR